MGEPIKIVVTAETAAAAANLQAFLASSTGQFKAAEQAAHGATTAFGQNRMAIMEIGHSARSMADGLAAGMSPLRLMMMEAPRLMQSGAEMSSEMRQKILSAIPVVGMIAAGFGAAMLAVKGMRAEIDIGIERNNRLTESFQKQAEVIKTITGAAQGGMISGDERGRLLQMLGMSVGQQGSFDFTKFGTNAPSSMNAQAPVHGRSDFPMSALGLPDATDIEKVNAELARMGVLLVTIDPKTYKRTYSENPELQSLMELTRTRERYNSQMELDFDKQRARAEKQHAEELRNLDVEIAKAAQYRTQLEGGMQMEKDPTVRAAMQGTLSNLSAEKMNDAKVVLEQEYQDKLAAIDKAEQDKKLRKEEEFTRQMTESQNKIREAAAKQAAEDLRAVEDLITANQDAAGNRRGELIQAEYKLRIDAAERAYFSGAIAEEEYTHLLQEAAHKRAEAEKQYNSELERSAALKKQIEQMDAEGQLRAIEYNDQLTRNEKAQQSVPIWQAQLEANQADASAQQGIIGSNPADSDAALNAQAKKNELLAQQLELQDKIDTAQEADSFADQLGIVITKLRDMGTLAQQTAAAFGSAWTTATNSIGENISKVIQGTETWRQACINIYNSILNEVVTSFVRMAVSWIEQHVIMAAISSIFHLQDVAKTTAATESKVAIHASGEGQMTLSTAIGSLARQGWHLAETIFHALMVELRVAAHIAGEIACTAVTYAQALIRAIYHAIVAAIAAMESEASVPYVGVILGIAAAAAIMAAAVGLMGGFQEGGFTGSGRPDEIAGVVHRGEFVVPANAVNRIGLGNLEAMRQGGGSSSAAHAGGSGRPAQHNVSVHTWMDQRQMANALERDPAHEQYVVDVMSRNIHRFR